MCEVQTLDVKAVQRRQSDVFIGGALEDLFDSDDRNHEVSAAKRRQELASRANAGAPDLSLERHEKRCIKQDRTTHRLT